MEEERTLRDIHQVEEAEQVVQGIPDLHQQDIDLDKALVGEDSRGLDIQGLDIQAAHMVFLKQKVGKIQLAPTRHAFQPQSED